MKLTLTITFLFFILFIGCEKEEDQTNYECECDKITLRGHDADTTKIKDEVYAHDKNWAAEEMSKECAAQGGCYVENCECEYKN